MKSFNYTEKEGGMWYSVRLWDNIVCPFLPCLCCGLLDLCSSLSFLIGSATTWHLGDVHVEQAQCAHAGSGARSWAFEDMILHKERPTTF